MKLFITFTRRHWYRKKKFTIPICLRTTLIIAAIIIGSVLGSRRTINVTNAASMIFDIFFQFKNGRQLILQKLTVSLHIVHSKTLKLLYHKKYAIFASSAFLFSKVFVFETTFINYNFRLKSRKKHR
jgi:hypothetical protein